MHPPALRASLWPPGFAPSPSHVEGPRVGNQIIRNKIKPSRFPKESIEVVGKELEIFVGEGCTHPSLPLVVCAHATKR